MRGDGRHMVVVGIQKARLMEPPDDVLDRHWDAGVSAEDQFAQGAQALPRTQRPVGDDRVTELRGASM